MAAAAAATEATLTAAAGKARLATLAAVMDTCLVSVPGLYKSRFVV
jgi:hypothetical protein